MRVSPSLVLFALAIPCFPQAMIEHAAAAAGGSTGALAGKPMSDSLGKIFGKVDQTTAKAAKPKPDAPKAKDVTGGEASRTVPVFGAATASVGMPASSGGVTRQNRPIRLSAAESQAQPVVALVPAPIPVHHASQAEVLAIQTGTARNEVLAKLGPPASMVTIPDEGHMLEIFKYVSGSHWLGTVRLDNGAVVRVDSAQ